MAAPDKTPPCLSHDQDSRPNRESPSTHPNRYKAAQNYPAVLRRNRCANKHSTPSARSSIPAKHPSDYASPWSSPASPETPQTESPPTRIPPSPKPSPPPRFESPATAPHSQPRRRFHAGGVTQSSQG